MTRRSAGLLLFLLLQSLMICACSTVIPYEPDAAHLTRDEARSTLKRAFEEQPEKFRPVRVEIGDDAIRLELSTTVSRWTAGLASIEKGETYYFSNLADVQLIQNKGRLLIELSNREGSVRRWVFFYNQKQATAFLDAMSRMTRPE